MAHIKDVYNKQGILTGFDAKITLNVDGRQVQKKKRFPLPQGNLTPAKLRKEEQRIADEWERAFRADYLGGRQIIDKDKITLAAFIDEHWLPDHVRDGTHTPKGVRFFEDTSANMLSYFGGKKKLVSITTEDCKRYIVFMKTQAKQDNGEPYSAATVKHNYDTMNNILGYAERMEYIPRNPTRNLSEKDKPKVPAPKIDFLEPEDARRFMECLETEPLYWRALMSVLITCGLRRGEAIGLQWKDIDEETMTIKVERSVEVDKNADDKVYVGPTKTGRNRVVPLPDSTYSLLAQMQEERRAAGMVELPHSFIFHRPYVKSKQEADYYKPIYPTTVTRWQQRFVQRHNLPKVSPHDLRHTAGTLALEGGANLKQVQDLLGHSNPATTMKYYAGVTAEAQRRTVEGIENILKKKQA